MDGSGVAGLIAAIMVGGVFGFLLPGYVIVVAAMDHNWKAMIVGIIWISITTAIVVAIVRWILKDPAKEGEIK